MRTVTVSSPARVSLFGEYSKLIGETIAIALADLQTTCTVTASTKNQHVFTSNLQQNKIVIQDITKSLKKNFWGNYVLAAIKTLAKKGHTVPYLSISVSSNIPLAEGASSSSSLIVSIIFGISEFLQLGLKKNEIAEYAYLAETSEMGIPCGRMDHYSCALGGVQYLNNTSSDTSFTQFLLPKDTRIVIAKTGTKKDTKEIISNVFEAYSKGDPRIFDHIKVEKNLIKNAKIILSQKTIDLKQLGLLLNTAHRSYQNNLRSSSNIHDLLCDAALEAGAFGSKISGGGFGGCVFALTDITNAQAIRKILLSVSPEVYVSSISYSGCEVLESYAK